MGKEEEEDRVGRFVGKLELEEADRVAAVEEGSQKGRTDSRLKEDMAG